MRAQRFGGSVKIADPNKIKDRLLQPHARVVKVELYRLKEALDFYVLRPEIQSLKLLADASV